MLDISMSSTVARALATLAYGHNETAGVVILTVDPAWDYMVKHDAVMSCVSIGRGIGYKIATQDDTQTVLAQAMGRALMASDQQAGEDRSWLMVSRAGASPFNVALHVDAVRQAQENPAKRAVVIVVDRRGAETDALIQAVRDAVHQASVEGSLHDYGAEVVDLHWPASAAIPAAASATPALAA